ncbi:PD-(D/E)XK nuclease family protein, partial [Enterovirga sp.]|uniref:PD-(D/E)XK nuclease family protein n=1 Tax=Enterovirga sp. TaxID=2026350 RepID=UPI002620624B
VVGARRPAPRPGGERFPRSLSVTEIETLVRDPYAVFARHILRLSPLDPLGLRPNLADRGSILHEVLAAFAAAHPGPLPPQARAELIQRGLDAFRPIEEAYPELYALWAPDFERMVPHLLEWEHQRRAAMDRLLVEKPGRIEIPLPSGPPLAIRGYADRIEIAADGSATVVDFKSGRMPSLDEVRVGFAPQLTLEAAMVRAGGFEGVPPTATVPNLLYVKLGGRDRVKPQEIKPRDGTSLADLVEAHVDGVTRLAGLFASGEAGYLSRRLPRESRFAGRYDHLARVGEWSVLGDSPGGEPLP